MGRGTRTSAVVSATRLRALDFDAVRAQWLAERDPRGYGYEQGLRGLDALQRFSATYALQNDKHMLALISDELLRARGSEGGRLLEQAPNTLLACAHERLVAAQRQALTPLAEREQRALSFYVGAGFRAINPALRRGHALTGQTLTHHQALSGLLARVPPLTEPLLVSRGLRWSEARDFGFEPEQVRSLYSQPLVREQGYVSTGALLTHLAPDDEHISLMIELPIGARVLSVCAFDAWNTGPREVILAPGSELEVLDRVDHDGRAMSVHARLRV